MKAIFAKLQARYGARFASAYDDDTLFTLALDEWGRGLAGMSGEDIRRGLDSWQGEWPPSLPEFVNACRLRLSAAHRIYRALPKPDPDPEKAHAALEDIRQLLRKTK